MSLQQAIEAALKEALRANADVRKTTIRGVIAGIKNARVDKQADLSDEEVQGIVRKEIKAQREVIVDAQKAARPELITEAESKIQILEEFIPQQLSRSEIADHVKAAMAEVGATGPADMGKVMKVLQPKLKDLADGKTISAVVKELLQSAAN